MTVLDAFRLDGDVAVVTGGDRGIGRAIAQGLAEAGADVVVANRNVEAGETAAAEIAEATGVETLHVETDVTDPAAVQRMVDETVERFGGVDVLVNNAGVVEHVAAEEMTDEEWNRVIDVNLTGAFYCSRAAGREMIEGGGGRIVNVSSVSAFIANHPQEQVSYQASKAGLEGFKTQLASEWAEFGVRVNNINPGYVMTEMAQEGVDPEMVAVWHEETLREEFATPEEIAPLAVYLASEASSYVTGESVVIDGGMSVR